MPDPDLANKFTHHPPIGNQAGRYMALRSLGFQLAKAIDEDVPDSDEKTLAIACVRQAVMWANAGIACNEVVT